MFEQSLIDSGAKTRRTTSVLISFIFQMVLLGVGILIPLLNYYELPATQLMTFLVAPPPPPPPPPPPVAVVKVQKVVPREFDSGKLVQPVAIPDKVAVIEEDEMPQSAGIAGVVGGVPGGMAGGSLGGVIGGIISSAPDVAPPPPPPVKKAPPPTPKRIRVGGSVQRANLINQTRPVYPPLARQARIQGTVKLTAIISKDGSIQKLEVLSGHPLLIPAALQAVKEWRYKPTLLNGEPVEVVTQVDVNFTLSG
jgi:protein TonB